MRCCAKYVRRSLGVLGPAAKCLLDPSPNPLPLPPQKERKQKAAERERRSAERMGLEPRSVRSSDPLLDALHIDSEA